MIGHISWPVIGHNRWPISDEQCNFDPLLFCCKIKRRAQNSVYKGLEKREDSDVDFEASRRSTREQSKSTIRSALFLAKH